jgi:hypothetical protein
MDLSVQGLSDEEYNWRPPGLCNPISLTHAHASLALDFYLNGAIKSDPLIWPAIAEAEGMPQDVFGLWEYEDPIAQRLIRDYTQRVRQALFNYLDSIGDGDLAQEVDSQMWGMRPVGFLLLMMSSHTSFHAGEIAAVKGTQGLKGQPF